MAVYQRILLAVDLTPESLLIGHRARALAEALDGELEMADTNWRVVVGNSKSEIIRVAVDDEVNLIVIGSRERHGLAFLTKPTEDVVVHRAPCDVLAVRLTEQQD